MYGSLALICFTMIVRITSACFGIRYCSLFNMITCTIMMKRTTERFNVAYLFIETYHVRNYQTYITYYIRSKQNIIGASFPILTEFNQQGMGILIQYQIISH